MCISGTDILGHLKLNIDDVLVKEFELITSLLLSYYNPSKLVQNFTG